MNCSLLVKLRLEVSVPEAQRNLSCRPKFGSMEDKNTQLKRTRAAFLAKETGITEDEAWALIEMIGMDMGSLLREARILRKSKDRRDISKPR